MSLTGTITSLLQADTTLMATLTGGAHEGMEISRPLTPTAFDANEEIQPCCLVKTGTETAREPVVGAVQTSLAIYFYQRSGYAKLDAALLRVYSLLERRHLGASGIWEIRFNNEIARTRDDALDCSLAVQRYDVVRIKS